jgi:hypothetical protein
MAGFKVEISAVDRWKLFRVAGPIDETSKFPAPRNLAQTPVVVDAVDVERVNSVGVAAWIGFFATLTSQSPQVPMLDPSHVWTMQLRTMPAPPDRRIPPALGSATAPWPSPWTMATVLARCRRTRYGVV